MVCGRLWQSHISLMAPLLVRCGPIWHGSPPSLSWADAGTAIAKQNAPIVKARIIWIPPQASTGGCRAVATISR